jgi:hypothetical protein
MDWETVAWAGSIGFLMGLGLGQWATHRIWRQTAEGIALKKRQPMKSAGAHYYVVTSDEFLHRMQRG